MFRALLTAICTAEIVAPEKLVTALEELALENPELAQWRSWVMPGARVEGMVLLWMLWRSDQSYATLKRFVGLLGLLVLLFPRAYVDYGTRLAYTSDSTPEWRPWVYTGTRVVGVFYVLVGLRELLRQRDGRQ